MQAEEGPTVYRKEKEHCGSNMYPLNRSCPSGTLSMIFIWSYRENMRLPTKKNLRLATKLPISSLRLKKLKEETEYQNDMSYGIVKEKKPKT